MSVKENTPKLLNIMIYSIDDLQTTGVRIRLYGCERLRRERMVGECIIWFSSLGIPEDASSDEIERWVILQPRSNLSVSILYSLWCARVG